MRNEDTAEPKHNHHRIRVFISSTFRDMHAERDHLVTVVFPELRERCEELGLEFFDVDLRWGVPEKGIDGERANSWEYCRQWINRVEPFFVSILGQRYGYVPKPQDIRDPADRKNFADLSITEMEVRHAVLTGSLRRRSFFYFRKTRVPKIVDAATKKIFVEDDDKVEKLKNEISKGSRPVRKYSCDWMEDHFVKLEEFGRQVLDDLWSGVLRDQRYISMDVWRQVLGGDPLSDSRYTDESIPVPEDIAAKIVELAKPAPASPLDAEAAKMEAFAASRLRWFTGRTEELRKLSDFVEATGPDTPAMAVVGAVPGQGKSALLAKLHQKLNASSHFVITHFVGATERSADPRALVKRLINELDRSGIAWPEEDQEQETKDDFISQIFLLARRLESYAGKRRIVLLLDAVNQLSDGHDLNWLPQQLGPNVRIIVSCIEDTAAKVESPEQTVLQSLSSRYPTALRVLLSGLTPRDIRAIVVNYLHEYCKELDPPHIDALCNIPQASNPLYLLVALSELRTLGGNDMNEIVPRLITSLPTDYPDTVSLFRWVVQRLEVFGKEETKHWCLYLAHGRTGMASPELADLLVRKFGPDAALSALRIERGLRRYLQRRGGQLDFFHSQLRQAVFEQYQPQIESAGVHMDIAAYFRNLADPENNQNWTDKHPRAISELPYHAWKAHSQELIYFLARDDGFLKTQQHCISEDPDLPLKTIRYALDRACVAEEPVQMAEFTLKHANYLEEEQTKETPLDTLMNPNLPHQVALERAWKLADHLDNQRRSYSLLLLTLKLQQLQRMDEAATTLARIDPEKAIKLGDLEPLAVMLLSQIKPIEGIDLTYISVVLLKDESLLKLTDYLIKTGKLTKALRIATLIEAAHWRSKALQIVASAQAKAGQDPTETFTEALASAGRIRNELLRSSLDLKRVLHEHQRSRGIGAYMEMEARRSEILNAIIEAQVQTGQFANAIRTASQIDSYWQPEALKIIAGDLIMAGQFAQALAAAKNIEDAERRSVALCYITQAQLCTGQDTTENFSEALSSAKMIKDAEKRFKALKLIAAAQAQVGQFTEAFRTAENIENTEIRANAFETIAGTLSQTGHFSKALASASRIEDAACRSKTLMKIVDKQVQAGQDPTEILVEALKSACQTDEGAQEVQEIRDVLRKITAGQNPTETFVEALEAACQTDEGARGLLELINAFRRSAEAEAQIQLGRFTQALAAIERTKYCSWVIARIAEAQAQAGQFSEALHTIEKIEDTKERDRILVGIADTFSQSGQFAQAFAASERIKDPYTYSDVLLTIAEEQIKAGLFSEALLTTGKVEDAEKNSVLLKNIAEAQIQSGQDATKTLAQALRHTDQIKDAESRSMALKTIADVQAEAGQDSKVTLLEALSVAGQIVDEWSRSHTFEIIAISQAKAGLFDGALYTASQIVDEWSRSRTFEIIAVAQAQAGLFDEAFTTASQIEEAYWHTIALIKIAEASAHTEQDPKEIFTQALCFAAKIEEATYRSTALKDMAVAQAQAGLFDEAIFTSEKIEEVKDVSSSLKEIAVAQAQAGQDPTKTFAEALRTAKKIEGFYCSWTLSSIAVAQARAGQDPRETFAEGLTVAGRISYRDEPFRSEVFSEISISQAQAGLFTEAIRTTEEISESARRSLALDGIAIAQAQAGRDPTDTFTEALSAAKWIADIRDHINVLNRIAISQAQAEQDPTDTLADAIRIANKVEDACQRVEALMEIAVAQAKIGQSSTETLEKTIRASERVHVNREECLIHLVETLSKLPGPIITQSILHEILFRTAYYLRSAIRVCGLLTYLYPSSAVDISKLLGAASVSNDK